jgi:DNA-binding response OmpR family regulator
MNKRILIVDDEPYILHIVALKLTNAGYEVITAMDGEEAVELCKTQRPAMVITDYQMPFLSGVALCTQLQACDQTRGIPIMMLTARGFDISPEQMAESGISVLLGKPFSPREVLRQVQELLEDTEAPVAVE